MNSHQDLHDAIVLLALGTLPEDEARRVAQHAHECAECRAEYVELRAAADALGYAAESREGELDEISAARMKSRVMNAVRGKTNGSLPHPDFHVPASQPVRARSPWLPYMAAAAAVVFAIVSSSNMSSLRSQNERAEQQVAQLHADLVAQSAAAQRSDVLERQLAELTAPESKHFAVPTGEVITSGGRVYLALKVGELAPGKVYQAWTLRNGAASVTPSVTFVADTGITLVELPEAATGLSAVAVSVEPVGGSKAPTSKPAFVRSLS